MASSPLVASGFLAAIVEGDSDSLLASRIRNRASGSAAHRCAEAFHGHKGIRHFLAGLEQRAPEGQGRASAAHGTWFAVEWL
jgi:hypothetical protein